MSCYRFTIGWPGLILLLIWAGGNMALFWFTFASYMWDAEYIYIFKLLGFSLSFSRGAAQALNFNCALILLPVCRNLISLLRRCFGFNHEQCFGPKAICRQLDRNIFFHKIVAYSICFWTAIHYIGHCFNVERFVAAAKAGQDMQENHISKLPYHVNGSWVNPIRRNETFPVFELLTMIPGWSGLIALTVLIVMVSASTETIRRKFHEVFWYTHHLFVLFYIFIIVHGFGGIIRGQTNLKSHDPKKCLNKTQAWGIDEDCPWPEFSPHEADTWMWVTGPLVLYGIENIIKLVNRFRKVEIVEALIHPSDVLELKMKKSGFTSNAGQYITIMCPSLSYLQWHPFTLTSAPGDDFFSVHIRVVGDWTKHLCSLVKDINAKKAQNSQMSYPRLAVDGPFGTCCEDVFRYNVVMLIGAGIGVTPFASILKHIWYLYKEKKELHMLKKVHFHWICRDKAFRWFNEMLKQLEDKVQETGNDSFMSINIHLTRGWDDDIQKQVIQTISEPVDCLTELTNKTKFGRPNWEKIFKEAASEHPNEEVGVFYCGPKELTKPLRFHCGKNSNLVPHGRPRFIFHKENF